MEKIEHHWVVKAQISREPNHYILDIISYDKLASSKRYKILERIRFNADEFQKIIEKIKQSLEEGYFNGIS